MSKLEAHAEAGACSFCVVRLRVCCAAAAAAACRFEGTCAGQWLALRSYAYNACKGGAFELSVWRSGCAPQLLQQRLPQGSS